MSMNEKRREEIEEMVLCPGAASKTVRQAIYDLLAEVDRLEDEGSYDAGYNEGFDVGQEEGYDAGHAQGFSEGMAEGYENGWEEGSDHE